MSKNAARIETFDNLKPGQMYEIILYTEIRGVYSDPAMTSLRTSKCLLKVTFFCTQKSSGNVLQSVKIHSVFKGLIKCGIKLKMDNPKKISMGNMHTIHNVE